MSATLGPKLALARAVGAVSRVRGGGGTSLPGKLLVRMDSSAIAELAARLPRGSVLVSATNGKTTTAAMAASILEAAGISLVHNQAGANMAGGIASTLLGAAGRSGTIAGELGLFEVDELWLDRLAGQLHPRVVVLANLFRDQLDRYGELETIAERWAGTVRAGGPAERARLVCNADDPLVADLGRERAQSDYEPADLKRERAEVGGVPVQGDHEPAAFELEQAEVGGELAQDAHGPADAHEPAGVLYFGVDDDSLALASMAHAADAKHCRRCGAPYVFDAVYLGHLGHYHCESCGQRRPSPTVLARSVVLEGVRSARFQLSTPDGEAEVKLALPGLYNVYNALAAAALGVALGISLADIVAGLESTTAAFGRAETVTVAGRETRILLVKNPAGANEVLRTLALEPGCHDLLGVLNDNTADGHDVSWIWDADFELLVGRVRLATCSGTRAPELALRLKYAGIEPERIRVIDDLPHALAAATAEYPASGGGRLADNAAKQSPTGEGRLMVAEESAAAGEQPRAEESSSRLNRAAPLYVLPTYTAMLALRELLVRRGEADSSWQ
ncbi:MAG TPA: MurT ligase domain-containing protein [Solirubrobacteraceae bacterium]|jgi:UDP-N-acetylmuramyl tripeptide synthase|nr:MurT ligase domain-containing protein [Solirubrobacteraceae bacterium]